MTRTLDSGQKALVTSSGVIIARLVKLTTYTERDARKGPTSFYLSDFPLIYDYGNTGTDQTFWDILASVSEDTHLMVHVPQPDDLAPYGWGMQLNFNNLYVQGRRVYTRLSEENLHGADIEYSEIAIPSLDSYPIDLSAHTGDEHTPLFRGVVEAPGNVTDSSFTLRCLVTTPDLSNHWAFATATTVSKQDFGKRLPTVYGQAKKMPCITYDIGAATTLAQDLEPEFQDFDVLLNDASRFPQAGEYNVLYDREEITCFFTDDTHLHLKFFGRGQNGTVPKFLKAGAAVEEVTTLATFIVAGHECSAVDDIYLFNIFTDTLFRVTTDYTVNLRDTTSVPGRVVTSVTLTQAELTAMVDSMLAEARQIGEQPRYGDDDNETFVAVDIADLLTYATCMPYSLVGANEWVDNPTPGSFIGAGASADPGTYTENRAFSFRDLNASSPGLRVTRVQAWVKYGYASHDDALTMYVTAKAFDKEITWDWGDQFKQVDFAALADSETVTLKSDWITLNPNIDHFTADLNKTGSVQTAPLQDGYIQVALNFASSGDSSNAILIHWGSGETGWNLQVEPAASTGLEQEARIVSGGFNMRMFADVDGYKAPGDSITPGGTVTVIDDLDASAASWNSTNLTDSDETTIFFEGSGSLKLTSGAFTTFDTYRDITTADFTDEAISFRCYMEAAMYQALLDADTTAAFGLLISSDTGASTNSKKFEIPLADIIPDRWVELSISVNDVPIATTGTLVIASVDSIAFKFQQDAATSGRVCYIDKLERAPSDRVYSVAHGALIEHPVDVLTHWVEEVGGEVIGRADRSTALTNLGSNVVAGDARIAGLSWEEVAQMWAYSARANLVPDQTANGREWRILTPDSSYKFPVPTKLLSMYSDSGFRDAGRSLRELFTDSRHRYGLDASLGSGEEAYTSVVTANPVTSDVSVTASELETARQIIGSAQATPAFLPFINEEATAEEVVGYFVQEAIAHGRGVFTIPNLAWMDGYDLQMGDVVWVTPPWKKFDEEQIENFDFQDDDWTGTNGGTPFDAGTIFREGTGSLRCLSDGASTFNGMKNQDNIRKLNLRDRAISFWTLSNATLLARLTRLDFRLASGVDINADYLQWTIPASAFTANEWLHVRIQLDGSESVSSGSFDPTHVRHHKFEYLKSETTGADNMYFDDYRIVNQRVPCRVIAIAKNHETFHSDVTLVEVETA